jgi:enamine deaminase RidA (YjgF/YER057c/UK114 family)
MSPSHELLSPARLGAPIGLYSHASIARAGTSDLLFVAGQLAVDEAGASVGPGDFATQFAQAFENLGAVLDAAGVGFDDVVKFTSYVTTREHIASFYAERAELFPSLFSKPNYPPNTLLIVAGLVRPEFLLEVEAVAVVSRDDGAERT